MQERKFNIRPFKSSFNKKSKTMLTISQEVGVDKQKVYRCVKKHNIPYMIENDVMYFDEAAQTRIKSILSESQNVSKNISDTVRDFMGDDEKHFEMVLSKLDIIISYLQKGLDLQTEQLQVKEWEIERLRKIIEHKDIN